MLSRLCLQQSIPDLYNLQRWVVCTLLARVSRGPRARTARPRRRGARLNQTQSRFVDRAAHFLVLPERLHWRRNLLCVASTPADAIVALSAPPFVRIAHETLVLSQEQISAFAKKGLTPSQIGVVLRDSMGIPLVQQITGSKILRILKQTGEFSTNWR